MKRLVVLRLLLIIIGGCTFLMIPPLIVSLVLGETFMAPSFLIPLSIGLVLFLPAVFFGRKKNQTLPGINPREGFLLVFLTWFFASLAGSLPYHFSPVAMSFSDAIFESACGFATTGATTITNLETLPTGSCSARKAAIWAGPQDRLWSWPRWWQNRRRFQK